MAHNDLKIENLLLSKKGLLQQLKVADFENAAKIGTVRDDRVTPYICPPEVAKALCEGNGSQLRVRDSEDVWAVGVMVLRLMGIDEPFALSTGDSKLAPLCKLTQLDVTAVLRKAAVPEGGELESFLIGARGSPGCLAIEPRARATIRQLMAKGWISGGHHTQINREGVGAVREISEKMDGIAEEVGQVNMNMQKVHVALLDVRERIEAVRKTVVNMDAVQIPMIFTLELCSSDADNADEVNLQEAKSLFDRFGEMLRPTNTLKSVQESIDGLRGPKLKLRLLCQYTWEPVGEGYEIRAPRDNVPRLLPLLSVGLKGLRVCNGAAAIGQLFLGNIIPEIPEAMMQEAERIVDGLPDGLHAYPSVVELVGDVARGESDAAKQELNRFQQHEFRVFLQEHDPHERWRSVLSKVPLADGTVLWVSHAGYAKLEDAGELDTEGVKLQREFEEKVQEAQRRLEKKLEAELEAKQEAMRQLAGDGDEQQAHERAAELGEELAALRTEQEAERLMQAEKVDGMRQRFADLQREKMDELAADGDDTTAAMMQELVEEGGEVAERMAAAQGAEKEKLRTRLEARQRERAAALLAEIGEEATSATKQDEIQSPARTSSGNDEILIPPDVDSSRPSLGRTTSRTMNLMAAELRACGITSETEVEKYVQLLKEEGYDEPEDFRELMAEDGMGELIEMGFKTGHLKKIKRTRDSAREINSREDV